VGMCDLKPVHFVSHSPPYARTSSGPVAPHAIRECESFTHMTFPPHLRSSDRTGPPARRPDREGPRGEGCDVARGAEGGILGIPGISKTTTFQLHWVYSKNTRSEAPRDLARHIRPPRPENWERCPEISDRYWLAQKARVFELLGPPLMRPADCPNSQGDCPELSRFSGLSSGSLGPSIFRVYPM